MNSLTGAKNLLFKRKSTNPIVKPTSPRVSSSKPALPISDELDGRAVVSGVGVVRSVSHVERNDAAHDAAHDVASDVASSYYSTSDDELPSSESSYIVWQAKKLKKKLKLSVRSKAAKAKAALKAEQEAALKAEREAALKAEQEAALKAEQEAALKAEQEAALKAEREAALKAEREAEEEAEEEAEREAEEEAALKAEEDVGLKAEPEAALQAGFKELKEKKKAAEEEKKATSIALANKEQDVIIGAPYAHYYPHQYSYSEILLNLFCGIGNLVCGVLTRIKNIFCCIIFGCDFDKLIKKNTVNFNVKELKKIAVIYNLPAKDKDKSIHKKLDPPWCTVMDNMKRLYSSTEGRKISYLSFVSKIIGCKADVDNIINGKEVLCDALISTDNHDTNKIFNNKARWKTTTMNLLAAETSIIFLNCRQGLLNDHFIDGEFLSIRDLIIALLRQNSNTKIIVTEDEGSKLLKPGLLYNITTYQSDVEECQVLSQLERTDGFLTVYRIFTGTQRAKLEEAFQYTRA